MSYGGGRNGNSNTDWNYREQSIGRSAAVGSDPFGANDDFTSESDNYNDHFGAGTPSNTTTTTTQSQSRFGRPASRDLETDFNNTPSASSRQQRSSSSSNNNQESSPPRYGGASGGYRSSSSRNNNQQSGLQFSASDYGSGGYAVAEAVVEPPRATRATSGGIISRPGGGGGVPGPSLSRSSSRGGDHRFGSSSDEQQHNNNNASSNTPTNGLGVGVGVARMRDPYPSMSTDGAAHRPGATSVASAARRPNNNPKLLPPRKEATPIMPPSLAVEPTMPRPKTSRRFLHYTKLQRHPDLAVAKKVKNARYKAGDDDRHVLKCPNCQSFLKIPKMAVLMQCPTCSTVSPATSTVT